MFVRTMAVLVAVFALLVPTSPPVSAAPDNFTPRGGPTFNSPLGDRATQRAIFGKIIRSINSTPRRANIDIFSWNVLTREGVDALLRASRRNVRVRVLMEDGNLVLPNGDTNSPFLRLQRGLRENSKGRPKHRRSWARVCEGTCRGGKGSAHSKFFLFSRTGKARHVYMHSSANFTVAATTRQWNDLYTHRGRKKVYNWAKKRFNEAARDKRAKPVYASKNFKNFRLMMFPRGKNGPDPVMQMLNRVRCKGAKNTDNGRTRIMMAPDVLRNDRGMRIAKRLRTLWNRGCDMKLGYTVIGIEIGRYLREQGTKRGPLPMKHLVQDFDGDGDFDNYFHLKSMTIRGRYGKNRNATVMLNGSANWSGLGMISDENMGIYRQPRRVSQYEKHIEYWYDNFPSVNRRPFGRRVLKDQLIFGSGPNAIYEDGTPVSTDGSDPFATMERD